MEIPLTLLWYPENLNQRITDQIIPIKPIKECLSDAWSIFYEPESRMQAIFLWMRGKVPLFVLEVRKSAGIARGNGAING
jgi:hypothetical protein